VKSQKTILQRLALPDPSVLSDEALFWQRSAGVQIENGGLKMAAGSDIDLGAYLNLFNPAQWTEATGSNAYVLDIAGSGSITLRVQSRSGGTNLTIVHEETLTLPARLDLSAPTMPALWSLALFAEQSARIDGIEWSTEAPRHDISLAICITTFNRPAETAASAERITRLIRDNDLSKNVRLIIIDNGQSFTAPESAVCTVVPNRNLGGSGGFARGMIEAQTNEATHCLFMDDDAAIHDESLLRTYAYLALTNDRKTAVCGAMIGASTPTTLWENGALFHGRCFPQFIGTDLSKLSSVVDMEIAALRPKPGGHYGGWWFFAFPLAQATTLPFPFFVRGDDISFSLVNQFTQKTLTGVVSVQEDFADKESPQTQYLDLRNHLHHHLVHPQLDVGATRTAKIAVRFIARSILRMHYETCDALLLAWRDMIETPMIFEADPEAAKPRAAIRKLYSRETWRDMPMPSTVIPPLRPSRLAMVFGRFSLNGHLIPFWSKIGRRAAVHPSVRSQIWPIMGASSAAIYDRAGKQGYTVSHSKIRFTHIAIKTAALTLRWLWNYRQIKAAHRASYERATTKAYWAETFAHSTNESPLK